MSDIDARRQALRELAKEKARIEGKVPSEPSLDEDKDTSFKQASPEKIVLERRVENDSSFSWTQFAPWKKGKRKEKPKSMNTATIWCSARRMIAEEWRIAKGIRRKDPQVERLKQEAVMWEERREEEKREKEEARARFEKQRVKVDVVLKIIGQKILEQKENLTPEGTITLIEDAFGSIGKIYNVEWRKDGCDIWIEPWEERWSRGKEDELPVIYNLKINDELQIVSYDVVEDEGEVAEQEDALLERELQKGGSLDEEPLGTDEEDIKDALEKRVAEAGRLIELQKLKEDTWIATIEPWEEMKIRNLERKGQGPIETESILAEVVEGRIVTSPIKENKPVLGTAQQKEGGEDAS